MAKKTSRRYLRYAGLVARGIINNRVTLKNWIRDRGFPPGIKLGENTRVWAEDEVDTWLATRPTELKPAPPKPRQQPKPAIIDTG